MRYIKLTLSLAVLLGLIYTAGYRASQYLLPPPIYIDRPVAAPKKPLDTIVFEASQRSGVPGVLIRAVIAVESGGDASAVRHEPHYLARVTWTRNPDQARMWASSIGLMQVMATNLRRLKPEASYTLLFDPEVNVQVGAKILADCIARNQTASRAFTIRRALVCYNGSEEYPDKVFRELAEEVIDREL